MYDASGVRLEAGRQAQILNQIVDYFTKKNIPVVITRKRGLERVIRPYTNRGIWGVNSWHSCSMYSIFIIFIMVSYEQ